VPGSARIARFTDYFVITTGTNPAASAGISDEVVEQLKRAGHARRGLKGYQTAEWILIDYGDFIVHVSIKGSPLFTILSVVARSDASMFRGTTWIFENRIVIEMWRCRMRCARPLASPFASPPPTPTAGYRKSGAARMKLAHSFHSRSLRTGSRW